MKLTVNGHYVFTKNKLGEAEETISEFDNLITDEGLRSLVTVGNLTFSCWRCCLGTSVAAPTAADLLLGNEIVNAVYQTISPNHNQVTDAPSVWREYVFKYTFNPGTIPSIVSEVGIKDNTDALKAGKLFSRTLIKDEDGKPTTITVLPDEYLNIYYSIRITYPDSGQLTETTIEVNGVNHVVSSTFFNVKKTIPASTVLSPLPLSGANLTLNSITSVLTDIEADSSLPSVSRIVTLSQSIVSHNSRFSVTNGGVTSTADSVTQRAAITFTPSAGNLVNIAYMALKYYQNADYPGVQFTITPPISKTETQSLSFDIELTYTRD